MTVLEPGPTSASADLHGLESSGRSIFRPEAMRRHARAQEEAVLPRFVSPHTFVCLWLVLGLLGVGTAAAWTVRIPSYLTVTAVVGHQHEGAGQVVIAVLVPPTEFAEVRRGQRLLIALGGRQLDGPLTVVDPVLHSPAELRRELGLGGNNALVLSGPSGVALARLQPPKGLHVGEYVGAVTQGEIEVASVRGLSLVPSLGRLFGG